MNFSELMNLPSFNSKSGMLNVIIETPKGSRNKFSYDDHLGLFRLKKILPAGAVFPFDFGFVPGTLSDDGDPLDVLLLMEEPAFTGCLVSSQLIGVIKAMQIKKGKRERNDRLIAISKESETYCNVKSVDDLNSTVLDQIEHFFISYNRASGKEFKPLKRSGPNAARKIIQTGQCAFSERVSKEK
jgi:inorganic pyrophosphatase